MAATTNTSSLQKCLYILTFIIISDISHFYKIKTKEKCIMQTNTNLLNPLFKLSNEAKAQAFDALVSIASGNTDTNLNPDSSAHLAVEFIVSGFEANIDSLVDSRAREMYLSRVRSEAGKKVLKKLLKQKNLQLLPLRKKELPKINLQLRKFAFIKRILQHTKSLVDHHLLHQPALCLQLRNHTQAQIKSRYIRICLISLKKTYLI